MAIQFSITVLITQFALGVSDDAITSATATLYSPSQPLTEHLYFIKASWIGTSPPHLTIHSFENPFPDGPPPLFNAPTPVLSGTAQIVHINEREKNMRARSIGYHRSDNIRKQSEFVIIRADPRWDRVPWPPLNAFATIIGPLHTQDPVSAKFSIILDDIAWISGNTSSGSNSSPTTGNTPNKRSFLGKRKFSSSPSSPSSSSSRAASTSTSNLGANGSGSAPQRE
ncbi:hypothetical protein CF336_g8350 [Tilletia laevis]|nr:hypothetical protein CF336_g8350 [Tilletia laevis]